MYFHCTFLNVIEKLLAKAVRMELIDLLLLLLPKLLLLLLIQVRLKDRIFSLVNLVMVIST